MEIGKLEVERGRNNMDKEEWLLNLKDNEYPLTIIDHDRIIVEQ